MARPKKKGTGPVQHKGGKRNRKWKRNKVWCERYRRECREEINRKRRVARHCRRHPNDRNAFAVLDRLKAARYGSIIAATGGIATQ